MSDPVMAAIHAYKIALADLNAKQARSKAHDAEAQRIHMETINAGHVAEDARSALLKAIEQEQADGTN
jgi:hypothetical protein